MKQSEIIAALDAQVHNLNESAEVLSVYTGDFLSRVMGKAPEDCVWLTIMNNANVAGVAVLAEIPMIVLCEGVMPDNMLLAKAADEKITLATTKYSAYKACIEIYKAGKLS